MLSCWRSPKPLPLRTFEVARLFGDRMSALGCKFALDDFGAGFGSFYYLKHLVFDLVKIDGEFVENCHLNAIDRTIIRSIVGIARDLGKRTVAEFVGDQASFGCGPQRRRRPRPGLFHRPARAARRFVHLPEHNRKKWDLRWVVSNGWWA